MEKKKKSQECLPSSDHAKWFHSDAKFSAKVDDHIHIGDKTEISLVTRPM